YVSQGKPVVATWMPELEPYRDHVSMAHDRDEFLELLDRALVDRDGARREQRVALARANDWLSRYDAIESRVVELFPMVSMVVVSYDNAALTLQCVESILRNTTHPRFEVIVIDNASSDDSVERLRALAASDRRVSVHANDTNRGFAAAVN